MHHCLHQPHLPPSNSPAPSFDDDDAAAKRDNYNCGRYGLPKKGHSCCAGFSSVTTTSSAWVSAFTVVLSLLSSVACPPQPPPLLLPRHPISHLRRALLFEVRADEEEEEDFDEVEPDLDKRDWDFEDGDADASGLPARCLWEVLRRLSSTELLAVARVCKVWRETSRRVWRAAEDMKLRVPSRA